MAISFVALQLVSMATPANAETLNKTLIETQTMTTNDTTQTPTQRDEYTVSWVVFPVDAGFERMSSDFGQRAKACSACSTNHQGIDFVMPRGSTVRAVFHGTVTKVSRYSGGFGTTIEIKHPELNGITTLYSHMIEGSPTVKAGDRVTPGQKIGKVGNTGVATVNHLHFGIYIDGYAIDPQTWFKSHKVKRHHG